MVRVQGGGIEYVSDVEQAEWYSIPALAEGTFTLTSDL
jgi:hypothetical protein